MSELKLERIHEVTVYRSNVNGSFVDIKGIFFIEGFPITHLSTLADVVELTQKKNGYKAVTIKLVDPIPADKLILWTLDGGYRYDSRTSFWKVVKEIREGKWCPVELDGGFYVTALFPNINMT